MALAEPAFFSTLNHPARLLIDRMGACAMGFDAATLNGQALELEIRRVVQVIEQYPETGRRVFQLVLDEFQKFLAKHLTAPDATQRVVTVAQQVEQRETLAIQYTIELRNLLKDMPVRETVRDFLFKIWAEVLAMADIRNGPQHANTLALKRSAADLVWAASAKPTRHERARVIANLPALLKQLRTGMDMLGLAPNEQERRIKTLSDTLTEAFQSRTEPIAQAHIEALAKRLSNLEDYLVADEGELGGPAAGRGQHRADGGCRRVVHRGAGRRRHAQPAAVGRLGAAGPFAAGGVVHTAAQPPGQPGAVCLAKRARPADAVRVV